MDQDALKNKYVPPFPGCMLTQEDVKLIVSKDREVNEESIIENYSINNASDKMLGFLCDYWKLKVNLGSQKKTMHYFLKVKPVTNVAKADMVREFKLFERELYFYSVIQRKIGIPELRPWSARFVTDLENAMVFQDMDALQYKLQDKFKRFDMAHTLEALKTLTRFHASSIICEEKMKKELGRSYSLEDYYHQRIDSSYTETGKWFNQCMNAALDAIKRYSNYTNEQLILIEKRWFNIWSSGLTLSDASAKYRNVICHRDLWNNNLMFHYKQLGDKMVPDDCVLVDFQGTGYQPPAGDVMVLLYCNLQPKFREENMGKFLNFYLEEIGRILEDNGLNAGIIDRDNFLESAVEQRQWGIMVCACLIQHFWIDDDLLTKAFSDPVQFDDIFSTNKSAFVLEMMQSNADYKEKLMDIFEEIVERYCF